MKVCRNGLRIPLYQNAVAGATMLGGDEMCARCGVRALRYQLSQHLLHGNEPMCTPGAWFVRSHARTPAGTVHGTVALV